MMAVLALRPEERIALVAALVAHAALVAFLVWQRPAPPPPLPERISVTLADDVGLTSTAPSLAAAPAPDTAPEIGQAPEPPQPKPAPSPTPVPLAKAPAKAPPKPALPQKTPPPSKALPVKPSSRPGASRFDEAFAKGVPGAKANTAATTPPAATIGPAVRSALAGAISRQLKPRWVAPQGVDAEKLVTVLSWDLNPDGSLAGTPRVVRQEGITDANRAQAARHAEQALRAVRLAAPFTLPAEYYSAWRRIAEFRFDRKLSQ